jgi:hypothetical protein
MRSTHWRSGSGASRPKPTPSFARRAAHALKVGRGGGMPQAQTIGERFGLSGPGSRSSFGAQRPRW